MSTEYRAVEWFRPLVGSQQWDYVVIWKFGNDPSRFFEWMGCCCIGDNCDKNDINMKEEKSEKLLCRDNFLKHSVRTKACESLSHFPSFMPLYSGDHTEVVISSEPKWESSASSNDCGGTRLLIPVKGGLIELYTTKICPKDQKVFDLVLSHCKMISLEQFTEEGSHENRREKLPYSLKSLSLHAYSPSFANTVSHPCNERRSFQPSLDDKSRYEPFKHCSERSSGSKRVGYREELSRQKGGPVSSLKALKRGKRVAERKEEGQYHSSNLLAERERRKRIKSGLLILRSLVPNITKMDIASIPRDAVNYIKELQMNEKELREKIKEMDEEDDQEEKDRRNSKKQLSSHLLLPEETRDLYMLQPELETDVEVNQIGENKYFVKLVFSHKRGGFLRLLEAMDSLHLQVISINLITLNGRVQNILEIQGERDVHPMKLRDILIDLTS